MSGLPVGVPTLTYCRVLPSPSSLLGSGDINTDGNSVVILEPGQPSARFEVSQVIDKNVNDEEMCEVTFGSHAGGNLGVTMNPVSAFVNDSANIVILLIGSRATRKWNFLKRVFLPFIANEVVSCLATRSREINAPFYKAQLSVSAMEIQDEIIGDLLRPASKGLPIITTLDDGIMVQGLHNEKILDEVTLRRVLADACDNRALPPQPVGGSVDSATAIFEFKLMQNESSHDYSSRLVIVDVPSIDPLTSHLSSSNSSSDNVFIKGSQQNAVTLLTSSTLHKSLFAFHDVARRLNNPHRAQLAPFRQSRLTQYLSELLGGNAIVAAIGILSPGEPNVSRSTLGLLSLLSAAVHYPLSGKEISAPLKGLLSKYRALLTQAVEDLTETNENLNSQHKMEETRQQQMQQLQVELSNALLERDQSLEVCELLRAKYQTIMKEKVTQAETLANVEEDNVALAQAIIEFKLQAAQESEANEKEKLAQLQQQTELQAKIESLMSDVSLAKEESEKLNETISTQKETISTFETQQQELKTQLNDVTRKFEFESRRNLDLGAELLTLVNRNELLTKDAQSSVENAKNLQEIVDTMKINETASAAENKSLLLRLLAKDEELLALRKAAALDDTSSSVVANNSVNPSKNSHQIAKRAVDGLRALAEEKREKALLRRNFDLDKQVQRLTADLEAQTQLAQSLGQEARQLAAKQRDGLSRFLLGNNGNTFTSGFNKSDSDSNLNISNVNQVNDNTTRHVLAAEVVPSTDQALQELLSSYRNREIVLEARNVELTTAKHQAIMAYRTLTDHYRAAVDTMEDALSILKDPRANYSSSVSNASAQGNSKERAGTAGGGNNNSNNLRDTFTATNSKDNINDNSNDNNNIKDKIQEKEREKRVILEAKLRKTVEDALHEQYRFSRQVLSAATQQAAEMQRGLDNDQLIELSGGLRAEDSMKDRMSVLVSSYQKGLQTAEQRIAHLRQENVELRVQVRQLMGEKNNGSNSIDQPAIPQKAAAITEAAQPPQAAAEGNAKFNALVEGLSSEIQELRRQLAAAPTAPAAAPQAASQALLVPETPAATTAVPEEGTKGSDEAKPLLPARPPSASRPSSSPRAQSQHETAVQQQQQQQQDNSHEEQMRSQLQEAEQRVAEMASKQLGMQEELAAYRAYMQEILPQYQRQVATLQAQQQQLKQKAKKVKAAAVAASALTTTSSLPMVTNIDPTAASASGGAAAAVDALKLPSITGGSSESRVGSARGTAEDNNRIDS